MGSHKWLGFILSQLRMVALSASVMIVRPIYLDLCVKLCTTGNVGLMLMQLEQGLQQGVLRVTTGGPPNL